jgi:hypothetical protein
MKGTKAQHAGRPGACLAVMESSKPAERAAGVIFLRREKEVAVYQVGSGSYAFEVRR